MKKTWKFAVCVLTAAALTAGCSQTGTTQTGESGTETTAAEETTQAGESSAEAEIPSGSVVLGEYKGITAEKTVTPVRDEDVEARILEIRQANTEYVDSAELGADTAAKSGDIVNIDFKGTKDGVAFDGGTSEAYDLTLGSGSFIDGFEDGLIGVKVGETRNLDLTFPENYQNAELAGQAVVFEVKVNSIQVSQVPEFDEAFVQKMNPDMKTTDEYTAYIRSELEDENESLAQADAENRVLQTVLDNAEYTDIDEEVEAQYNEMWEQTEAMVNAYGMGMADYAAFYETDEEGLKEILHTQVENTVKLGLVSQAIAEAEGLTVEDSDIESVAADQGTDADTLITTYGEDMIHEYVIQQKAVELILENAVIQ